MTTKHPEPMTAAELDELEAYVAEALNYRHQPEFVHECARLLAEVRRLRAREEERRWGIGRLSRFFARSNGTGR